MSRGFKGFPVFDTADRLQEQADLDGYEAIQAQMHSLPLDQDALKRDLEVSLQYLQDYTDSAGTYNRFRGELQRFLNYLWLIGGRTLEQVDSEAVASYFTFLKSPPKSWIAPNIAPGFTGKDGDRRINPKWRPFTFQRNLGKKYNANPASLKASQVALSSFFRFLMMRRILLEDPFLQVRKRDTKAKSKSLLDQSEASVRRYTDWQWSYIKDSIEKAANEDATYERHLFVIITMKTLFLRVSELSVRNIDGEPRQPSFMDFSKKVQFGENYWTFYVFGKGDKARTITCPDAYLAYLKRWREHLGYDSPLPLPNDITPLLSSSRGGKGLGTRQVERLCHEGILLAVDRMEDEGYIDESKALRAIASETHYLRHTGASQAIEAGADIRHISEELGHASAAFTEQVYVNADQAKRRSAGRQRQI